MLVFTWAKFPFVRITIFFILGIIAGLIWPISIQYTLTLILITLLGLVLIWQLKARLFIRYNFLFGILISILFTLLGSFSIWLAAGRMNIENIIHNPELTAYKAEVVSEPETLERSIKVKLKVLAVKDSVWKQADGLILAYADRLIPDPIKFGQNILIKGAPELVVGPKNPNEFNYKRYLATNKIYHTDWVESENWLLLEHNSQLSLKSAANSIRNQLEGVMSNSVKDSTSLAILKALVLGDKNDLDSETMATYADAGVVHVLAVSGLHVGIIYIILSLLLRPVQNRFSNSNLTIGFIIVIALWLYAFITGLSPSVLRAVTMFSILAVGQQLNRKSSAFNSLALSAFILLWINPYLITQVGFQLSYTAVLGILLLYSKIEKLLDPKNRLLRGLWQLMAVSISAQLATAPLAAFYFHQFPSYFLISNLLVIPIVTLLVWGGILLIIFGSVSIFIGGIIGELLSFLVLIMNRGIELITNLPGSTIKNISIDLIELVMIYGFIAIIIAISYRGLQKNLTRALFVVLTLLICKTIYTTNDNYTKNEIVIYSVGQHYAIDLISDGEYISLTDSLLSDQTQTYSIKPYQLASRLTANTSLHPAQNTSSIGKAFVWKGKKVLITKECYNEQNAPANFDLIINESNQTSVECYADQVLLVKLVDGETFKFQRHSLRHDGAYVLDLNN